VRHLTDSFRLRSGAASSGGLSSAPKAAAFDATRQLDELVLAALTARASDVHFEPKEAGLVVRFRIDGVMTDYRVFSAMERDVLLARVKIFGGLDITEKRLPQDGRAALREQGRRINFRVSSLPTVFGESLVLRVLDQAMGETSFPELGLLPEQSATLATALRAPNGLIYLTGPTGSGKTTTLHAALHALDHGRQAIFTLEDPVEYEFTAIRQTEIRERIGLTFAACLRAILRQNPNIILVGETRDAETAQLSIRAALTGHLVLSTLHTNSAVAAIPRLRDLGIEPFLLASALKLLAGQRLVRRLCPKCKVPHPDSARLVEHYALSGAQLFQPAGCPECDHRGYRGREGIFEIVPVAPLLPLVTAGASLAELESAAVAAGGMTLRNHGLAKAAAGLTSLEEVLTVL